MTARPGRGLVRVGTALLACVLVSGCTAMDSAPNQARAGDNKNYVAGDGSFVALDVSNRAAPVEVSGITAEGEALDLTELRGEVVVINLWYAACGPCRAEADELAAIARETEPRGVRFVGLNTRDDADTVLAFQRTFDVPYPSVVDREGAAVLALRGQLVPNAVPTTLVIDRQGRVAARYSGPVDDSVLRTLIEDATQETA